MPLASIPVVDCRALLAVENLRQPVPDVAVDAVLLGLVEDFVPSAGVEPVVEHTVTVFHVAGDQRLNRGGLAADRVVGPPR